MKLLVTILVIDQTVTWIVPHPAFTYESPQGVDLRLMSIFVEFYTTMLGFVNFRLYHKLNLKYPPTLTTSSQSSSLVPQSKEDAAEGTAEVKVPATLGDAESERVAALNQSLAKTVSSGMVTTNDPISFFFIPFSCHKIVDLIVHYGFLRYVRAKHITLSERALYYVNKSRS